MIEVRDLTKTYTMGTEKVHALQGVSLKIEQGDFVAIMGASGSGKSTLLHVLGLLDTPDSGSYLLGGREVATLAADELAVLRSRTLGFIFQQFNLLPRTTAFENASLPLLYYEGGDAGDPNALLERVGLADRKLHKPNEMSGGQQQRVAIARSLVNKPRVVLADEPTGNLDSHSSEEIMGILASLNKEGITVVMVTHEPDIAAHASRIIRMKDGQVVSDERTKPLPARPPERAVTAEAPRSHLWRFSRYMKQALRALSANKIRTGLSILGILIGVAAVIAMLALGTGAQKSIQQQLASMGSNLLMLRSGNRSVGGVSQGAGTVSRLTLEDVKAIAGLDGVKAVAPELSGRVQVVYQANNWSTQATGTSPLYAAMKASVPALGRFFTEAEVNQRAKVAVVGMTVAKNVFGEDVNPVGASIKINRVTFQVIGVLPVKGSSGWRDQDDAVIVPVTTAMYRLLGKQYVEMINVEAVSAEQMGEVQDSLVALMRERHRLADDADDDFTIMNMADLQATITNTSKVMTTLLASIAAISLLVGGIGIMNIMLVSVTERTREIGLRKALGARGRDILSQFLIEAVVVSMTGGAGGILLGFAISAGIATFAGWAVSVTASSIFLAVFFSAGIGVGFGLWPAKKAANLNPIDALRYE